MDLPQCFKDMLAACCGSGSGVDCFPGNCDTDLSGTMCATLASGNCLDGLAVTLSRIGSPNYACRWLGSIHFPCGADTGDISVDLGVNKLSIGEGEHCDEISIGGNCGGGIWGVTASPTDLTHAPAVTWLSLTPGAAVGVARGWVVIDAPGTCPIGGWVDILITEGPC